MSKLSFQGSLSCAYPDFPRFSGGVNEVLTPPKLSRGSRRLAFSSPSEVHFVEER
jgi:hypothetical protein